MDDEGGGQDVQSDQHDDAKIKEIGSDEELVKINLDKIDEEEKKSMM